MEGPRPEPVPNINVYIANKDLNVSGKYVNTCCFLCRAKNMQKNMKSTTKEKRMALGSNSGTGKANM